MPPAKSLEFLTTMLNNLVRIFWPPAIVITAQIFRVILLPTYDELDMLMHFSGGATLAWMAWNAYGLGVRFRSIVALPSWVQAHLFIGTTALIGIVWEWYEFLLPTNTLGGLPITLADTLSDLAFDLAGATVWCLIFFLLVQPRTQKR